LTRPARSFRLLTRFDAPLFLFLLSAAGGAWIAYDKPAAWTKFWLIVGGLALYSVLARVPERIRLGRWGEVSLLRVVLGSLPVVVAIYFLLTNDWSYRIGKLPWLDPALRWFATWQPTLPGLRLNSNVVGGIIAALMPLQALALFENQKRNRIWLRVFLMGLSAFGLLLSESRGAWLALAVATGVWGLWKLYNRLARQWAMNEQSARVIWIVLLVIVSLAAILALAFTPWGNRLLGLRSDRLAVWRNSLDLASDYPFTGLGLGNFEMAYSSYALLVHVPHTAHAHNLFLDLWLEQGLLGLVALAWLVVAAAWPRRSASGESQILVRGRPAALASLGVILLHGLVDDAFYGYGGWAVLLMFLPFAVMARSAQMIRAMPGAEPLASRFRPAIIFCGMAAVLSVGISLVPTVRAVLEANLGALAQTQVELSVYSNQEWGMQDVLRRSSKVNLTPAIVRYQMALALDPANATANRRMGQIELSQGQYDSARHHLEAAYATAPGQRATRQLLGESYAIAGEIERAAALWRTVDVSQGQLGLKEGWYSYLGEKEHATRIAQSTAALNR
jgi:tetratricopeptide (TPR) repeat protein